MRAWYHVLISLQENQMKQLIIMILLTSPVMADYQDFLDANDREQAEIEARHDQTQREMERQEYLDDQEDYQEQQMYRDLNQQVHQSREQRHWLKMECLAEGKSNCN